MPNGQLCFINFDFDAQYIALGGINKWAHKISLNNPLPTTKYHVFDNIKTLYLRLV